MKTIILAETTTEYSADSTSEDSDDSLTVCPTTRSAICSQKNLKKNSNKRQPNSPAKSCNIKKTKSSLKGLKEFQPPIPPLNYNQVGDSSKQVEDVVKLANDLSISPSQHSTSSIPVEDVVPASPIHSTNESANNFLTSTPQHSDNSKLVEDEVSASLLHALTSQHSTDTTSISTIERGLVPHMKTSEFYLK